MEENKKLKVLGFMILHYGAEFLRESLLSIRDHVDKFVIAYTRLPSQGFASVEQCPEIEEELYNIAESVLGDKLIWNSRETYEYEAAHRNVRYVYSKEYDLILTIDADEVFEEKDLPSALQFAYENEERYYGIIGYYNFWRSFNWVCTDGFRPIRIEKVNSHLQTQNLNCNLRVYHFSMCQAEETMRYKYKIFGHSDEIKPNYLEEKYFAWTPEKIDIVQHLHPTSNDIWGKPEPFDKETLPEYLKQHPNFNKDLV